MYLTDFRENTPKDVITKLEPELSKSDTGLTVDDFNLLVVPNVFNASHMDDAVHSFRRYEDSSLSYTGIESHEGSPRGLACSTLSKAPRQGLLPNTPYLMSTRPEINHKRVTRSKGTSCE